MYWVESERFVRFALRDISDVQFVRMAVDMVEVTDYSQLLKMSEFWKRISAEKVLIFQSDSIMLRFGIDRYLRYDYIGAPWDMYTNDIAFEMYRKGTMVEGVGNGGFSLRSVNTMKRITDMFGNSSLSTEPEDLFFARNLQRLQYDIAPHYEAYAFCMEVKIEDYEREFNKVYHLALHASWYYLKESESRELLLGSIPK